MGWFNNAVEQKLKDRCKTLEERILDLRGAKDKLEDEYYELETQHNKLKRLKKIEEEEIAHKIRCREEQVEIEKQKGIAQAERSADERVMKVKQEYQDKLTAALEKRGDELKGMYTEVLARLPEVDVKIGDSTVKSKKK